MAIARGFSAPRLGLKDDRDSVTCNSTMALNNTLTPYPTWLPPTNATAVRIMAQGFAVIKQSSDAAVLDSAEARRSITTPIETSQPMMTSSSASPTAPTLHSTPHSHADPGSLSSGGLVGIMIGTITVVTLLVSGTAWRWLRRRRRHRRAADQMIETVFELEGDDIFKPELPPDCRPGELETIINWPQEPKSLRLPQTSDLAPTVAPHL